MAGTVRGSCQQDTGAPWLPPQAGADGPRPGGLPYHRRVGDGLPGPTMRQASRRSWRIGLSRPVKVVLMAYRNNLQADALKLVAKKPQPSLAVEGRSHLRLRLPMPGLVFVCSPGRAPWVYAAAERPADLEQHLFRAPAFNVFRDGRVCPGSHRFPEEVGLIPEGFFQSFFLSYRRHPGSLEEAPRQPAITMGGDRWNNCIPD